MIQKTLALTTMLIEEHFATDNTFQNALINIELDLSLRIFKDAIQCVKFLSENLYLAHPVLFMNFFENGNKCLDAIKIIRGNQKYKDLSIVVYDSNDIMINEDIFIAGGNIYIQKVADDAELEKVIKKVLKADNHHTSERMNREYYILSL